MGKRYPTELLHLLLECWPNGRYLLELIHLEKRHRKAEKYDIQKYADQSAGFSGSEIEEIIVSALYDAYDANRELVDSDLENTIKTMIPLSQTMEEQIKSIREWAKLRARRASSIEWENETKKKRQLEV